MTSSFTAWLISFVKHVYTHTCRETYYRWFSSSVATSVFLTGLRSCQVYSVWMMHSCPVCSPWISRKSWWVLKGVNNKALPTILGVSNDTNCMTLLLLLLGYYVRQVSGWMLALLLGYLSVPVVINLFSSHQLMNTSFDPLRIVNTYGAFGR